MAQTAELFMDGESQAVRLPMAFRFDAAEVFIRKDPETGDVILSARPSDWEGFFAKIKDLEVPEDFLSDKERDRRPHDRDPFEGLEE